MKKAGEVVRDTLELLIEHTKPGVSTLELNNLAHAHIEKCGAIPSFLNYRGYPASICVSIDSEVVHGIPRQTRFLCEGSIVSYDVGAILNGWHGDAARTVFVGKVSEQKRRLVEVTEQCFFEGIKAIKSGARLGDIGAAVQTHAEAHGYGVVRVLVGHGIGQSMHESPDVPNFGRAGTGLRIEHGMTLAIEPMINAGGADVYFASDNWTVLTSDGTPSAHYENTVAVTENGVEILTL